jgi:hypothetical protein
MIRIDCLSQQVMCHDRFTRNFPAAGFDNRSRRRRGDSGHRLIRARAGGEGFTKASEVSGHAKGGAELNCVQFETPSSCKTVDGTVAAQGWCMVYAKKQA